MIKVYIGLMEFDFNSIKEAAEFAETASKAFCKYRLVEDYEKPIIEIRIFDEKEGE